MSGQVREVAWLDDADGYRLSVGVLDGSLVITAPWDLYRFDAGGADALAQILVAACWEAWGDGQVVICPADCGAGTHDQACRGTP